MPLLCRSFFHRTLLCAALLGLPWTLPACGGGDDDTAVAATETRTVGALRLIGEQRLPWRQDFRGTTVGGLSGIDRDPASNRWVLISDDRSDTGPARLYTAQLSYTAQGFDGVTLTDVQFLRQADGSTYPNAAQYAQRPVGDIPDLETVRIDPLDGRLWYASEGNRSLGLSPFVRQAERTGTLVSTLPMPALFTVSPTQELGPRNNATFEGLTFAADGQSLWVALEAPLYQDGPLPTAARGAVARLTRLDRSGRVLGQVAYAIDALPAAPAPGKNADNGISEILAIDEHRLLVLERSGVQGADDLYVNHIRLYEVDLRGATDVAGLSALATAAYTPAAKRLVLNLNTLGLPRLDNIEGLAWGPRLANGHDSLVMVSDDNFSGQQVTQFLAFEVMPR